jgi:protein O-mannosyl-transferase
MSEITENSDGAPLAPGPPVPSPRLRLAVCGLLVLAVALVFGQTVAFQFVNFDDDQSVYRNVIVRDGLTQRALVAVFTQRHIESWCPLTCVSHMFDWQLYGDWAGGHHLNNVLLHAGSAVLLFLVLQRMTACFWASAMVAACFAVHPLHVESVAWVTERKDTLSALFFMLTLAAYVRYARGPFSWRRYLAVIGLFAVGLLAKPIVITAPVLLLVLDYWPLGRMKVAAADDEAPAAGPRATLPAVLARLVLEKVPLLLLVGLSCGLTIWGQADFGAAKEVLPLRWRLANACISGVSYIGQTFWPAGLAVFYPRRPLDLPILPVLAALLLLLGITVAAFCCWRRFPYLLVGWLWYLGTLAPVIGIVQFGNQSEADRFTYLAQVGLCIALVWGAADLCRSMRYGRWLCGVVAALVLAVLMGCAWRQTSFWCDSVSLWRHALACTSHNSYAHNDLGLALAERGQRDAAIEQYRQALAINRRNTKVQNNLGLLLAEMGRLDEAIEHYGAALAVQPDYPEANNNLANALAGRKRFDEAVVCYRRALKARPWYLKARLNLTTALAQLGRFDEAIAELEEVLKARAADVRKNLAAMKALRGRLLDSVAGQRESVRSHPDDVVPLNELAWTLATNPNASVRNGEEAVKLARHANELAGDRQPEVLGTLAAAQAEAGQFPDAVRTAKKALELATAQNKAALADSLRSRIKLYEARKPCRASPKP